MNYILKIVKSLKDSDFLKKKDAREPIEDYVKEQKGGFIGMFLGFQVPLYYQILYQVNL